MTPAFLPPFIVSAISHSFPVQVQVQMPFPFQEAPLPWSVPQSVPFSFSVSVCWWSFSSSASLPVQLDLQVSLPFLLLQPSSPFPISFRYLQPVFLLSGFPSFRQIFSLFWFWFWFSLPVFLRLQGQFPVR